MNENVKKKSKPQLSLPFLRFKGFDEEWTNKKLGSHTTINTGDKDLKDKDDNGLYPFYVRSEKIESINSFSYDGEAILIPGDGKIGDIFHYINGKFDYHQRVYKISDYKDGVLKFLYYLFQKKLKKHLLSFSAKATVDSIRLPMLKNFSYSSPLFNEQNKISKFFSLLDKQISLWERKLELSLLFYKYYLGKLIPNNHSSLRFKQFLETLDWYDIKKFEEIFKTVSHKKYIVNKNAIVDENQKENINDKTYIKVYEQGLDNNKYSNSDNYLNLEGDSLILFGDHTRNIKYITGKSLFYGDGIKLLKTNNSAYYYHILMNTKIKSLGYSRHFKLLKECSFFVHLNIDEQNCVSHFLWLINSFINIIKNKIFILKERKKYYINSLFI